MLSTKGISNDHFTRVVRADPKRKGLLYAGTETGMYISFDDGISWQSMQMNLPVVPITDLAIKNDNLIAATQGRSFWMIDDLTPFHQLSPEMKNSEAYLFKPLDSYRIRGGAARDSKTVGKNHPGGVMIHYYLEDTAKTDTLRIEMIEPNGKLIKAFSTAPDKDKKEGKLNVKPGLNRMIWNMRYPGAEGFDGMILWWASLSGPMALPGDYKVRMVFNGQTQEQNFTVLKDPRSGSSETDLKEQFDFLNEVIAKLTETNTSIKKIREARKQINTVTSRLKGEEGKEIKEKAKSILKEIKTIEEALYQTKNQSNQDPLNFPIRLNNKLGHLNSLMAMGDYKPTQQAREFKREVSSRIDAELSKLSKIFDEEIPKFNALVKSQSIDAVILSEK